MSTQLIPFLFDSHEIRVITHADGSWSVVAKDVAEALGYVWARSATIEHVPEEWRGSNSVPTPSGNQDMLTLTEQGLYFFMGRSDKPKALPFQKWVAGEVLPSIRKTGRYETVSSVARENPRWVLGLIQAYRAHALCNNAWDKAGLVIGIITMSAILGLPVPDMALLNKPSNQMQLEV